MNNKFSTLYDFIDRAVKSRKYPDATAQTLRAALKLYEPLLNEEELESVDKFKKNFDQITASVFNKNASKFSASSLATYRSRVQKVLDNFEKYNDPIKMNSWSTKVVLRTKKTASEKKTQDSQEEPEAKVQEKPLEGMHKIELALRPDKKFIIIVPMDITSTESTTIKAILDSLIVKV